MRSRNYAWELSEVQIYGFMPARVVEVQRVDGYVTELALFHRNQGDLERKVMPRMSRKQRAAEKMDPMEGTRTNDPALLVGASPSRTGCIDSGKVTFLRVRGQSHFSFRSSSPCLKGL